MTQNNTHTLATSGLFTNTANVKRPFKLSIEGFAGSGKTFTAGLIAAGIWHAEGNTKPIVIIDTEDSAKFLIPLLTEQGCIEGETLFVSYSRSLADFGKILRLCEAEDGILLIDSLTHIHEDMVKEYKAEKNKTALRMHDHLYLKPFWKEHFSDPFIRARCHILFTGRAAWEYSFEDDEDGQKQLLKSGVRMRGDSEVAYEPDVLVLMTRREEVQSGGKPMKVWREGTVLKDRSTLTDGQTFKNPTFKDFAPTYQFLVSGAAQRDVPLETPTAALFDKPNTDYMARRRQVAIILEELRGLYDSHVPGMSGRDKKMKADIAQVAFGTRSWTALEGQYPQALEQGVKVAEYLLQQVVKGNLPEDDTELLAWLEREKAAFLTSQQEKADDLPDFAQDETKAAA